MRLVLRVLGADVLELATGPDAAGDEDKRGIADLSGTVAGQFEQAEDYGRPDTTVTGGFDLPDERRRPPVGFQRS